MNGKKAKLLRKLAGNGEVQDTKYDVIQSTRRKKTTKDHFGNTIGHFTTGTLRVVAGTRYVNKSLKKMYNSSLRAA